MLQTNGMPSLAAAVRSNLTQLECEAEALSRFALPPDRERELERIQRRIEDLRVQLAMIGG